MSQMPEFRSKPENTTAPAISPLIFGGGVLIAFAAGLLLGFVTRPAIIRDTPVQVVVTATPNSESTLAAASTLTAAPPTPTTPPDDPSPTQEPVGEADTAAATPTPDLMDFVLADARHFQGDEAAPVTLVEFSDFK
jgi:hypothetical protein